MRPKTKLQKQVLELSKKLSPITDIQREWGFKHCFEAKGYKTKKNGISCLMCGCRYRDDQSELLTAIDGCTCPECGTRLKITNTRKQKDKQSAWYGVITTYQGFQVIRLFMLDGYFHVGERARLMCQELVQIWIAPNGKHEIIARLHSVNHYVDYWSGDMEIRNRNDWDTYCINPYRIYPKMNVIPELQRNGFRRKLYDINPFYLFRMLLSNPKAETLFKANQINMIKHAIRDREQLLSHHWDSLKICLRNNYIIKDAQTWCDYISFLKRYNIDVRNPKYVCPSDLKVAHDRIVRKHNKIMAKQAKIEQAKQLEADREEFFKLKGRFLDIQISDGEINIVPLSDPSEYIEEGITLHHCVGSSNYYLKPNTLVMSARIDGKPIETIEISLSGFNILQCQGICNENSKYHDKIIRLVENNMFEIKKRAKSKRKDGNYERV